MKENYHKKTPEGDFLLVSTFKCTNLFYQQLSRISSIKPKEDTHHE